MAGLAALGILGGRAGAWQAKTKAPGPRKRLKSEDFRRPGDTDRHVLQRAVDALGPGIVLEITGDYMIDGQVEIIARKGFELVGRGTITLAAGTAIGYGGSALYFSGCADFEVSGVRCDGNRRHRAQGEAAGHVIVVDSCHRWRMSNVRADNGPTDGFLVQTTPGHGTGPAGAVVMADIPHDWVMQDCDAQNNARQGLSIIESVNWEVRGGSYSRTVGLLDVAALTGPCAGIDLEPDRNPAYPANRLRNGVIRDVEFAENQGPGLLISNIGDVSDIAVIDCRFVANRKCAIECYGRDIEITGSKISRWNSEDYSIRPDIPKKRGLIDVGFGAGPNIRILDTQITEIVLRPEDDLPLIFVHGQAREGIIIRQLATDGSASVLGRLHGPAIEFSDSIITLGRRQSLPVVHASGRDFRMHGNEFAGLTTALLLCSSTRPSVTNNAVEAVHVAEGDPVFDCSRAESVSLIANRVRRRSIEPGIDFKVSARSTVVENVSVNNSSDAWLIAPSPIKISGNRKVSNSQRRNQA